MKNNMLLSIVFVLMNFTSIAQVSSIGQVSKDTLYTSDSWWHIGIENPYKNNSNRDTTDYSIHQKVEILKSDKTFKITIGDKVYEYMIVSSKRFKSSISSIQYTVSLNGTTGELNVTDMKDGSFYVNINWEIGSRVVQAPPVLASLSPGSK